MRDDGLYAALMRRGMSRRAFLGFSAAMAGALALPLSFAPHIARAVEASRRLPVIWVRGQACGGNTEALLRSADPSAVSMFLDVLDIQYHESLLAVAGGDAQLALTSAMDRYPDGYIAMIEGAVPDGASGAYSLIGGRPAAEVVRDVAAGAMATVAVGSCASDGGAPSAGANTTRARGVRDLVPAGRYVALPGCPVNPVNLAAVIVHYLALGTLPPADLGGRPLFAYGNLIHNQCERRPHFEFGEFATEWGDEGAQKGWCLYKLGCKGPETMGNCPTVRYGQKTSWNVRAGHGCIGCMSPGFWDQMGSAYRRLPSPVPFLPNVTADMVGGVVMGGIAGVTAVHAVGMGVRFKRRRMIAAAERAASAGAAATVTTQTAAITTTEMAQTATATAMTTTATTAATTAATATAEEGPAGPDRGAPSDDAAAPGGEAPGGEAAAAGGTGAGGAPEAAPDGGAEPGGEGV